MANEELVKKVQHWGWKSGWRHMPGVMTYNPAKRLLLGWAMMPLTVVSVLWKMMPCMEAS